MTGYMQQSVYAACAKVGRRRSALSPELLKHLLQRGTGGLPGVQLRRDRVFAERNRKGEPVAIRC